MDGILLGPALPHPFLYPSHVTLTQLITPSLLVSQHWQQFEPQLTLWDVFGASKEVKELLAQGLLLLDHRSVGGGVQKGAAGSLGALTTDLESQKT